MPPSIFRSQKSQIVAPGFSLEIRCSHTVDLGPFLHPSQIPRTLQPCTVANANNAPKKACPSCGISVTILPLFFSLSPVELNQPRKSSELKFHHPVAGVATAQHRQGADARAVKASKHAQNARRARIYHIPVLPQKLACGPMHGGYFLPLRSQRPVPANRGTVSNSPAGLLGLEDREKYGAGDPFLHGGLTFVPPMEDGESRSPHFSWGWLDDRLPAHLVRDPKKTSVQPEICTKPIYPPQRRKGSCSCLDPQPDLPSCPESPARLVYHAPPNGMS
jgi:hypothetical protein